MSLSPALEADDIERAPRTGPVGRAVRVLLGVAVGAFVVIRLATFADHGPTGYRDPSVLLDASLWILTVIVVASIVDFAGRFAPGLERFSPAGRRSAAIAGLGAAVLIAAGVGLALHAGVWGFPLADLWWWLNTAYVAELTGAFGLAVVAGTPGCEGSGTSCWAGSAHRDTTP